MDLRKKKTHFYLNLSATQSQVLGYGGFRQVNKTISYLWSDKS